MSRSALLSGEARTVFLFFYLALVVTRDASLRLTPVQCQSVQTMLTCHCSRRVLPTCPACHVVPTHSILHPLLVARLLVIPCS